MKENNADLIFLLTKLVAEKQYIVIKSYIS